MNPMYGKTLVLELCVTMLLANQNVGFFKMYYPTEEVNNRIYFDMQIDIEAFYNLTLHHFGFA